MRRSDARLLEMRQDQHSLPAPPAQNGQREGEVLRRDVSRLQSELLALRKVEMQTMMTHRCSWADWLRAILLFKRQKDGASCKTYNTFGIILHWMDSTTRQILLACKRTQIFKLAFKRQSL